MPNLTQSAKIAKNIAKITIPAAIIAILVIVIYLQYSTPHNAPINQLPAPKPPIIYQEPGQKQPQLIDVSQIQLPQIPNELPAYQVKTYPLADKDYADIASTLGVNTPPSLTEEQTIYGKQVNWKQDNSTLTINQYNLRYENQIPNQTGTNLSEDQIKQKGDDFMKKLSAVGDNLIIRKVNYLKNPNQSSKSNDSYFQSAASFDESQTLEIVYDKKLSNYPLYAGNSNNSYAILRITKDGTIIYFASKIFQSFTPSNSYKLKSTKDAINQIQNHQGKVVQTQIPDQNGQILELFRTQPQSINVTNIKSLTIAYLLPTDITQPIQPVFVAGGEFKNSNNDVGEVTIYLPAFQ